MQELAAAVDEIGEQLLVADEEFRVQNEQLSQSARRLDLLVAAHEELFANADVAFVQTDANGVVVRVNRAARRLLELPMGSKRCRVLPNLFRSEDRPAMRLLISRIASGREGVPFGSRPEPLEAVLTMPDGGEKPVVVTARRSSDGGPEPILLHWELRQTMPAVQPGETAQAVPLLRQQASALQLLAQVAVGLARQETPAATLQHVTSYARDAITGCDEVSVTLSHSRGHTETPAGTGELAFACDRLQHELDEGPCIGAIDDSRIVRVPDMSQEIRWPTFAREAAGLGVGSMLVLPLAVPRGTLGALNLYARTPNAFDDDAELIAMAFATHAAIALAHTQMEANLRTGMASREEIGRAVGILMERHRVTATRAFDMLVYVSQHTHRKLRDIAAWVDSTGEDPSVLLPKTRGGHTPG